MLRRLPYAPPAWARGLKAPGERYQLGMFPTPVHPWQVPGVPAGVEVFAKRDDLSGMQLSGNKVRKLEFLLAEAHAQGADSVVTIGGIQSNHCRATAVAARYLGLDPHLVLRNSAQGAAADPGLVGNLLVERMVGATIHQVTKAEYAQHGGQALGEAVAERLRAEGRRPYVIPVGGSNALGSWGYLEAIRELEADVAELGITDIACACGSGGTIAGLALGAHLSGLGVRIHAFGVCDSPDYFYDYIDGLLAGMGSAGPPARELLEAVDVKGAGYALSREEELAFCCEVSARTGIVLDPVYSGKAMFGLVNAMRARPGAWAGRKVLFIHTGGLLGMYDKVDQLAPLVAAGSRAERLEV